MTILAKIVDDAPAKFEALDATLEDTKDEFNDDLTEYTSFVSRVGKEVAAAGQAARVTNKPIWIGGYAGSNKGSGWTYLQLNRVDLDAKQDFFAVNGDTFTIKKAGIYRLNYIGKQRGRYSSNSYSIIYKNDRSITAYGYNTHRGNSYSYNAQDVDLTWKFLEGDRIKIRLDSSYTSHYGGTQGRVGYMNRVSLSYEGSSSTSMQC
jgi:hypothetical protein